jgi:trimeric autotransporter adhesin
VLQQYILSSTTNVSVASNTGILAVQITDPLHLPSGVSDVYVTYSNIRVHAAGFSLSSGWYTIANSTTVNLTRVTSLGTTIGSGRVISGTFDLANVSIGSASVTYQGNNYSTTVVSEAIATPIVDGGVIVQPGSSSGFVIDFSPTILSFQGRTGQSFCLAASATSLPIPSKNWDTKLTTIGATENLNSTALGPSITTLRKSSIVISSASLGNGSLTVAITNKGATPSTLTALNLKIAGSQIPSIRPSLTSSSITSTSNSTSSSTAASSTTSSINTSSSTSSNSTTVSTTTVISNTTSSYSASSNSTITSTSSTAFHSTSTIPSGLEPFAEFAVLSDGSLVESTSAPSLGYVLNPGASVTLSFRGSVTLLSGGTLAVIAGQIYDLTVLTSSGAIATYAYSVPYD